MMHHRVVFVQKLVVVFRKVLGVPNVVENTLETCKAMVLEVRNTRVCSLAIVLKVCRCRKLVRNLLHLIKLKVAHLHGLKSQF